MAFMQQHIVTVTPPSAPGPKPGGSNRAIAPHEIFKKIHSCWVQQHVTMILPHPRKWYNNNNLQSFWTARKYELIVALISTRNSPNLFRPLVCTVYACFNATPRAVYVREVAGVTFSDSDSVPVPKILNSGPEMFQIWQSDTCSDSGYYRSIRNVPMFLLEKWPHRILLLHKLESDSGFSQNFDTGSGFGSERKRRILPESTPDPRPPMLCSRCSWEEQHFPQEQLF